MISGFDSVDVFDVRKIRSRNDPELLEFQRAATPVTIVSADSHVLAPAEDFINYLEPRYRHCRDTYMADLEKFYDFFGFFGYPFKPEVLDIIDTRGALRAGGEIGTFDPLRRLREVEAEGVVAELLNPGSALGFIPLFDSLQSRWSPEMRAAGARAHNRFLADYCSEAPDRLLGVYLIYPWPDMDAIGEQCRRVRELGGKAVKPPMQAGVPGDPCPAFFDRYWDPMWAACEENELVVHIHAGHGGEQGTFLDLIRNAAIQEGAPDPAGGEELSPFAKLFETFRERIPLWQLMWGGVFDRFPRLKISFLEIHGDWVPGTLAFLDKRYRDDGGSAMQLSPSEYWARNCAVGASLLRHGDVAARHAIGVDRLMFGTDYPHREGTWPNTLDWIRASLNEVPEKEARMILGDNAIDFYGLDRALLEKEAMRIGPTAGDLLGSRHSVDSNLLENFEDRGGIGKRANIFETELLVSLDATIESMAAAQTGCT